MINAQLEGIESLLGNLRRELLAVDPSITSPALESRPVSIKDRIPTVERLTPNLPAVSLMETPLLLTDSTILVRRSIE